MESYKLGTTVILPTFVLPSRQNEICTESGIDSLKDCLDKNYFKSYPYTVEYNYNSRGFRDTEWPSNFAELKNSIWCVGDSFTVGLGSPIEHTWPYILQKQTNTRTINVSMDGASNYWISRKALQIIKEIDPLAVVVHWSYLFRGEDSDTTKTDEERRKHIDKSIFGDENETDKFIKILQQFKNTKVIHSFIPGFTDSSRIGAVALWKQLKGTDWPELPLTRDEFNKLDSSVVAELKNFFNKHKKFIDHYNFIEQYNNLGLDYAVPEFEKIDLSRDSHHYDKITATAFVDQLLSLTVFPR